MTTFEDKHIGVLQGFELAISAAFKVAQRHNLNGDVAIELINEVIEEIRFEKTKYIVAHIKEHKDGI